MKKNINKSGRIARAIIGIIAVALSLTDFFEDQIVDIGLLIMGAVLLIAAVAQMCPLYHFLGINTYKTKKIKMY